HASVALVGYLLFGGIGQLRRKDTGHVEEEAAPFGREHWITMVVIVALVLGVLVWKMNIGMAAFACAAVLALTRASNDAEAIRKMPWNTLVMVSGVTVLIGILEKTQGIELFAGLMAKVSTPGTVTAVVAFLTGVVSVYSSTSGVVLPAFLPAIPSLMEKLGGGSALAVASAMNIGGHLVDVSPLSTLGALCLAGVTDGAESKALFSKLLAWGLSMCVVGAGFSWVFFR
ncbi:MAG: anion permease, partial [Bryobacterales bacterium]|nr:anion permease [Bryobacterales bacterium]